MFNKIKRNSDDGFTLVELIAGLAIIAVLVAIAVPSYFAIKSKANTASVKSDMTNAAIVIQQEFYSAGQVYPTTISTDVKTSKDVTLTIVNYAAASTTSKKARACIQGVHSAKPTEIYNFVIHLKTLNTGPCPASAPALPTW